MLDSFRNIPGKSRIIVSNALGKNKVLLVESNGRSLDVDLIKEMKIQQLRVSGDQIKPIMNLANS